MNTNLPAFVFALVAGLIGYNASAQYSELIVGKWVIDSAFVEPIDSGRIVPDVQASMKNEVVQFNADGTYFTFVDTARKANYRIGTPETPVLLIESKPDAAVAFRTEAEILTLDRERLNVRMFTPEYTMYVYYSRKPDAAPAKTQTKR